MAKKITKQQICDYWGDGIKVNESDMGVDFSEGTQACWCCGRFTNNLEKAHIVPAMLGGEYEVSNLVLLCSTCHREAPDFDNPQYMWDWIKANSAMNHEAYTTRKTHEMYEKIFGEKPKYPEWVDDMIKTDLIKATGILKEIHERSWKKAGHHGGTTSWATEACVLRDTLTELDEYVPSLQEII